jgi:hypothetical protein
LSPRMAYANYKNSKAYRREETQLFTVSY